MATEQRVSRLEGAYEQVDRRLDSMDRRLSEINNRFDEMNSRFNSRFNNLYVLIGASWVTLIGAMIGLYFR